MLKPAEVLSMTRVPLCLPTVSSQSAGLEIWRETEVWGCHNERSRGGPALRGFRGEELRYRCAHLGQVKAGQLPKCP